MLRWVLLALAAMYAMVPAASATLLVYVTPENVTKGESFLVFAKLKNSDNNIVAGSDITYFFANYSGSIQNMQLFDAKYAQFPGTSSYWTTPSYYSGILAANRTNFTAKYVDPNYVGLVEENASANITVGNITISIEDPPGFGPETFNMTKKIGENITLRAYLKDSGEKGSMSYRVYPLKITGIIPIAEGVFSDCGPALCANYTITSANPAGIISIYARNSTDVGGRNIFFAASPYNISPAINATYPSIGASVEIALNMNNIYGSVSGVNANLTYPNGTNFSLYFSEANAYKQAFSMPNISGDYILNLSAGHTINGTAKYGFAFRIQAAYLDMKTDKAAYKQGENATLTVTIYDSNGTAIASSVNATVSIPGGTNASYNDTNMGSTGNVRSFNYTLASNAQVGAYNISLNASDTFGRRYSGNISFTVNALNMTLLASPSSITHSFSSISNYTYTINLTSNSTAAISSIQVSASQSISPYVVLNLTSLPATLSPGASAIFNMTVTPNTSITTVVSGNIVVAFDGNTLNIPVTILNGLAPSFDVKGSYTIEAATGKSKRLAIDIKNNGTGIMPYVNMSADSNISAHIENITLPGNIPAGTGATAYFDIKITAKGKYSGKVTFFAPGATNATVLLSIDALEDISGAIDTLGELRKGLSTRILSLEANGKDVSSLGGKATALQESISDLKSLYDNGKYSEAKTMLLELQADASEIQEALDAMEVVDSGNESGTNETSGDDGVCGSTESCSSTDCIGATRCQENTGGGFGAGTVLIILFAIIAVVVLATSIMPDEKAPASIPI